MNDAMPPAEPIPFRVLLDDAMKRTRRHFKTVYPAVAIPIALAMVGMVTFQMTWIASWTGSVRTSVPFNPATCLGVIVGAVLSMVIMSVATAALIAAAVDAVSEKPVDMKVEWGFILRGASLATLTLQGLAVLAGMICLLFPGIWIFLMLSFVVPVMAAEDLRGGDALKRSWALVRYNPHHRFLEHTAVKVFLLYFVAGLISYAVSSLVQLPFTVARGVLTARDVAAGRARDPQLMMSAYLWLQLPSVLLGSLVSTAVSVYSSFGLALLYFDVRRRKEGTDLQAAIGARFGAEPTPPATSPA
ncbi:MAG: hypothetical protein ABI968_09070 [Acidobacteriota bacterium]